MNQGKLDLPEIYGIWQTPFFKTYWGVFIIILASLAFIALIFLIFKFFNKRRKMPYWIKAKNELNELAAFQQKNLFESNKIYTKLTFILKDYIQNRYNFFKYGLTDFELLEYIRSKQIDEKLIDIILTIFQNAQEAKFAHTEIIKSKIESDIQNSVKFVNLTKPKDLKKENNGARPDS